MAAKWFNSLDTNSNSRTKTSKICLGTFFIPVTDIEEKKDRNKSREENFYEIDESLKMDMEIFGELAKRKCKFVHNINGYIKKERKATSSFMEFSKCTCIAWKSLFFVILCEIRLLFVLKRN